MDLTREIIYAVIGISCITLSLAFFGHATTMYQRSKADVSNPYWHSATAMHSISSGVWFMCFLITIYVARH